MKRIERIQMFTDRYMSLMDDIQLIQNSNTKHDMATLAYYSIGQNIYCETLPMGMNESELRSKIDSKLVELETIVGNIITKQNGDNK